MILQYRNALPPQVARELDQLIGSLQAFLEVAHNDDGTLKGTQYRCRVSKSSNQAIADATNTAITFTTEEYDVGEMHDSAANTSRITVPSDGAGGYLIQAGGAWESNVNGTRRVAIYKNGVAVDGGDQHLPGNVTKLSATTLVSAVPGDYFELIVAQTSTVSLNFSTAAMSALKVW